MFDLAGLPARVGIFRWGGRGWGVPVDLGSGSARCCLWHAGHMGRTGTERIAHFARGDLGH